MSAVPIGITNKNIDVYKVDLVKNLLNIMVANTLDEFTPFITSLIGIIKMIPNVEITIIDAEGILKKNNQEAIAEYKKVFKKMNNSKRLKENIIIVIGLSKFLEELGKEELFVSSLENAEELKKCHYLIFESASKLNDLAFNKWYKKYISGDTGVWLGNGVGEQYLLKTVIPNYKMASGCGNNYGYAYLKGKPYFIKLLGMKESEENE